MSYEVISPRAIRIACAALTLVLAAAIAAPAPAAQAPDDRRGANYVYPRAGAKSKRTHTRARYRRKGEAVKTPDATDARIGVTFWKARPARPNDRSATRDIVQAGGETQSFTLVRLGSDPELTVGDQFRVAIETLRSGYLYVIDRPVRYGDSKRPAYLIFPTRRIRGGDNRIEAGRMIMIPTPPDEPPFEIRYDEGNLVGEELIILVTPEPLDVVTRMDRYRLDDGLVDSWIERWGVPSEMFDLEGGAGAPYTLAEKTAATNPEKLLTIADPMPQVVHRLAAKPGDPLLLRLTIHVRESSARSSR